MLSLLQKNKNRTNICMIYDGRDTGFLTRADNGRVLSFVLRV